MNRLHTRRASLPIVLVLALSGVLAVPATAQSSRKDAQDTELRIPKPKGEPTGTPITSLLTAVLVSAGVLVVALLPSKRGHQD